MLSKLSINADLQARPASAKHQQVLQKRFTSEVVSKLKVLKKLLKEQDSKCWEIGDLCIDLMDNHYIPLRDIAKRTSYSKARICHFHLTARTFNSEQREGFTFQDSLTARQVGLRLPRLSMSPAEIRAVIVKLRNKTPRQVKAYFLRILYNKEQNMALAQSARASVEGNDTINRCYNTDWREVIPNLPDRSVKLFIADPPFAIYRDMKGGYLSYRSLTSPMRADCDNNTTDDALAVTLPLFQLCMPKLAENGVLLIFQAGGKGDRPELLIEADRCGWQCAYALTWQKGLLLTSGNNHHPYRICSERILVFCRKNESVIKNQNGMPASDILNFPTETPFVTTRMEAGSMPVGDYHIFQKPQALMEFLIQQHSYPGELVCSTFGCSGVDALAAIKLRRQWVYVESNEDNYNWGANRIAKALNEITVMAG
jgi:DNA modification methylase